MHLVLQCRAPGDKAWDEISQAPVIQLPGYGIDAAKRKLDATRERYKSLGVLHPDAEYRIVRCGAPLEDDRTASTLVTLATLAAMGAAAAVWLGVATHAI